MQFLQDVPGNLVPGSRALWRSGFWYVFVGSGEVMEIDNYAKSKVELWLSLGFANCSKMLFFQKSRSLHGAF